MNMNTMIKVLSLNLHSSLKIIFRQSKINIILSHIILTPFIKIIFPLADLRHSKRALAICAANYNKSLKQKLKSKTTALSQLLI